MFDDVEVISNTLRTVNGELKVVKTSDKLKAKLIVDEFKFYLEIGTHKINVHLAYADYDMMEFIYIDELPKRLVVFDMELPVPF